MKVLNKRTAVLSALSLMLGVFLGGLVYNNLILTISIPVVLLTIGMLFFMKKRFLFFSMLLCISLGIGIFCADYHIPYRYKESGYSYVNARIEKVGDGYYYADSVNIDGTDYDGKMKINYPALLTKGDEVAFIADIEILSFDLFDSYSSWLYCDEVYYEADVDDYIEILGTRLTWTENVMDRMVSPMYKYMDAEDAGIAKSLVFGDTSDILPADDAVIEGTGLSHIFSLSGLHVGFLMGLIYLVTKRLKLNRKLTLAISVLVLLFYGIITGFPSGLKRAAIMTVCALSAPIFRGKNDPLNTLGVACFFIILLSPRELFSLSCLMSVGAVLGIVIFYRPLKKIIVKKDNGLVKYLGEGVCMTLSSNIFLLPVMCNVFNSFPVYAVVGNLVVLPLVSVSFTLLAVIAILTLIFSGFGVAYYVVQFPITAIRLLCNLIFSLPYSTINMPNMGISSAFFILAMLIVSPMVRLNYKWKIGLVSALSVLWCISFIFL